MATLLNININMKLKKYIFFQPDEASQDHSALYCDAFKGWGSDLDPRLGTTGLNHKPKVAELKLPPS